MTWSEWKNRPDAMSEVVAALRHGGTLTAFANARGIRLATLHGWIGRCPERAAAYEAVKLPQGRPTKLDAAATVAVGMDYQWGAITPMSRFLGVSRKTLWNWGVLCARGELS